MSFVSSLHLAKLFWASYLFILFCNEALDPTGSQLPELIPGFCSMKRLGLFLLPLDRMLVHRRLFPSNCVISYCAGTWHYRIFADFFLESKFQDGCERRQDCSCRLALVLCQYVLQTLMENSECGVLHFNQKWVLHQGQHRIFIQKCQESGRRM